MRAAAPIDRLSGILEHFRVHAQLHHSGALCGLTHFDAREGYGYLHVLRRGQLEVSHPGARGLPGSVRLDEPTLVRQNAQAIYQQVVVQKLMPMNNATQITDAERALIGRWFEAGALVP